MAIIVVMDIGKTNAKLCLIDDATGELISSEATSTRALDIKPYLQLDTATLWQWYLGKLKALSKTAKISHIAVTAHGASAALIDDYELVLPVMDYEFQGINDVAERYNEICDPYTQTYSPRLPLGLNLGRQLYWQREKCPRQFARAKYLIPYPQYWSYLLTGIPVSEVSSIGAHSDLWNPIAKTWSDFAVREGFTKLCPAMCKAGDVLGHPSAAVIKETGIDASCKVLVGIHDSNASLIPWMKSQTLPYTVMSTGTWTIIFAQGSPLEGLLAERDCIANVNIHSEPIACSRFMGGREFSAIAGETPQAATMEDLLAIIDDKIFALPSFTETGGPFPGQSGKIITSRDLTPTERYALASIYCALLSDESLTLCGSKGNIIVEGAFAKNTMLLQCLAVYRNNQTVFASSDSTGTTIGTAMLMTDIISTPDLIKARSSDQQLREKLLTYKKCWHHQLAQSRSPIST